MVNKNRSAVFKECLYMVLDSNNLWDLADEQWFMKVRPVQHSRSEKEQRWWGRELTTLLEVQRWDVV